MKEYKDMQKDKPSKENPIQKLFDVEPKEKHFLFGKENFHWGKMKE